MTLLHDNVGCSEAEKTKRRRGGLMRSRVNLVMSLLRLESFKGFPFLNMTLDSLHHLALPSSPASSLGFRSPMTLASFFHLCAFWTHHSFRLSFLIPTPHLLLQLKNHFLREVFPDPQIQSGHCHCSLST